MLILESAIPQAERDRWDEIHKKDPLREFHDSHDKYLVAGEPYPYDEIH